MKSGNSRLRLLAVLDILRKDSDENTPITATDILEKLNDRGISAERKAIYEDIACLNEHGFYIEVGKGKNSGYRFLSHSLADYEVNMIVDALRASGFVSEKGALDITERLSADMSRASAAALRRRKCIINPNKCASLELYEKIDLLSTAASEAKQVKIVYTKNKIEGNGIVCTEKTMTVNPYAVLQDSDRYYLVGNNAKYDNLTNLRIDRIKSVEILKEKRRHFSEVSEYKQYFDVADYARKTFNMYSGKTARIDIECKLELLDLMTDKFGTGIFIRHFGNEDCFRFTTDAVISEGLICWFMQFGGRVNVLSPKEVREELKSRAEDIVKALSK